MPPESLAERVARYVAEPDRDRFDELAMAAFEAQYEWNAAYRERCDRQGSTPGSVGDWREIPAVPAAALATSAPELHVHPELYGRVIEALFRAACLPGLDAAPILRLLPTREQAPDSHLSFICSRAAATFGAKGSAAAFRAAGVDFGAARSWLAARQRDGRPSLIAANRASLERLLDALDRHDLRFQLPVGSRLLEAAGFRDPGPRETDEALRDRIEARMGVPATRIVHLRGMIGLTSHFYTGVLAGGEPDLFVPPHWTRVRILDPETLREAAPGARGVIAVFDLANVGSALHVMTGEPGVAAGAGFRVGDPGQPGPSG